MKNHDLILSNQSDDNDVESIMSRCIVVARKPGTEDPPEAPEEMFVSSYRINFEGHTGAIELKAYDGPDEPWPIFDPEDYEDDTSLAASVESIAVRDLTMTASSGREPKMEVKKNKDPVGPKYIPRNRIMQSPSMSDGSKALKTRPSTMSDSASSSSSTSPSPTSGDEASLDFSQDDDEMGQATEGSTTNGRIWIGPEHQVDVPPFTPGQKAVSRNPTLVWKPGSVPDEILDGYLNDASKFLNEYMQKNGLVVDDPYAPLPSARVEALVQAENNGKPMTLSRLSTASTLSTPRNELTRECKIDQLLIALQYHHYNPKEALSYVAAHPRDFLTIWTRKERDVFDATFRRHSGSLRMISKALSGTKTFKDVVDYHYRFKIPDQFRRYQEKKREQAVRMMECIETRRSLEAPIYQRDEAVAELRKRAAAKKKDEEWYVVSRVLGCSEIVRYIHISNNVCLSFSRRNKTSASDVIGAVEERRASAKELFLQVQNDLGSDALNELAAAVKSVRDGEIEDVRDTFVEVLNDHPDLLDRFLAFLPKRYRGVSPRSGDMDVF